MGGPGLERSGSVVSSRKLLVALGLLLLAVGLLLTNLDRGTHLTQASAPNDSSASVEADEATGVPFAETGGIGRSFWLSVLPDMAWKLALVVGLVYLTVWALRRYGFRSIGTGPGTARAIEVLESANLAANRTLYVVDVAGKVLILGATQAQISLLSEVSDEDAIAELKSRKMGLKAPEPFARYLQPLMARVDQARANAAGRSPASIRDILAGRFFPK